MATRQLGPFPVPRREPFARIAYEAGYAIAAYFVIVGVASLVAHALGVPALAQPSADWPSLRRLPAATMIVIGFALWNFLRRRYTFAVAASALGASISFGAIAAYFIGVTLPWSGMSLAGAVVLFAISAAILLASARRRLLREEAAIGIVGLGLLIFTVTFLIVRSASLIDPLTDPVVSGLALQTYVGALVTGVCFLALISVRGVLTGDTARWLPGALAMAGAVTVLVLWRALATREIDQLRTLTRDASNDRRRVLVREADVAARALHRAAEWKAAGAPVDQQRRDADALRRDLQGFEAMGWVSALAVIDTAAHADLSGTGAVEALSGYIDRNGRLPDSIAFVPLDRAAARFVVVAPTCPAGHCVGAMLGVFRTADLFRSVLPDTSGGFGFGLTGRAGAIAGARLAEAPDPRWAQWLSLRLGATDLSLVAWPTTATIVRVRSALPGVVLLLGLLVSALVGLSTTLAQRTLRTTREAERARLANALERSTDGIWEWDIDTGRSRHSTRIWRHLGYEVEKVPPTRAAWLALVHPDDSERLHAELDAYLAGHRPAFETEYRVLARDGSWHTIADRGSIVDRTIAGDPLRMVGIKADVTEARVAQAARDAAERRFHGIFDSGFDFQLLLDQDGRVLEVNSLALGAAGVTRADVIGRRAWETLWWADQPDAQERLRTALAAASPGPVQRYEEEFRDADGAAPVHLEVAVKAITFPQDAPQIMLEARDLTAYRRAEAALREVETLTTMGRIAARVAHEINNPLAGIQNSFLLIKGAIPRDHPHFQYVGAIEREIARIAAVTRQLYETYRPERDATNATSVGTVIGDAVAFLEQVNRSAEVRVVVELSHRPSVLRLPSVMMRQLAYNLVQNAIEASPAGSTVHVRTLVRDGRFVLRVRDHGPGIPLDARDKVFEPFFTTKSGRIRTGGMGLGLSLVRRTVLAFGGSIEIADAEQGGCEFIVKLPLDPLDQGVVS